MSVNVNYKGSLLTTISNGSTKTLNTSGKYMEDNVQIVDTVTNGSAFPPAVTITKAPTFNMNSSTGVITASYAGSSSITPTVTSGWVSQGTAGTVSTSGTSTYQLTIQGAQTITPGRTVQYINSYRWLTGTQTIEAIPSSYIIPSSTYSISSNGTYDVGSYKSVSVNVIGEGFTVNQIAKRSIAGDISGDATTIGSYAFAGCIQLSTANFPMASAISTNAFFNCNWLSSVSFPSTKIIGSSAFAYCTHLETIYFPEATYIHNSAFFNCGFSEIYFPLVSVIGTSAFQACLSLITISIPIVEVLSGNAFCSCKKLTTISFPACTAISNYAFRNCYNLLSIYLLGSSIPSLVNINAFQSTPISTYTTSTGGVYGSIYVPASLYNSYITATNWSVYSARIVSV